MLDIEPIAKKFGLNDIDIDMICTVRNNIITKLTIIESCCKYFSPDDHDNPFHCSKAPKMQPLINLLALVTCAKAIIDDLLEIIRILFKEELTEIRPWRLSYIKLAELFPGAQLIVIVGKYGLNANDSSSNAFYPKVKKLRDTLIHRDIENTYALGSADFLITKDYTSTGGQMRAVEYAKEINDLMNIIAKEINDCLKTHGKNSLIAVT